MANQARDAAAAMVKALLTAELTGQTLAVGLADALEELVDRTADECDSRKIPNAIREATINSIIHHLRNTNHA